ncbi:hypothetical protein NQZ68_003453 [Dissostichus eleginoides]|nr:hypothetical protein NQZ68_003453 [Dissostichus eleginoides]
MGGHAADSENTVVLDAVHLHLVRTRAPCPLNPHSVHPAWWYWVQPQSQRPPPAAPVLISCSLHTGNPSRRFLHLNESRVPGQTQLIVSPPFHITAEWS